MNIHKNMKSLKRNAILLMLFLAFGIFINLLWILDSKIWITDCRKRKCIWSYWCGEIVFLLLTYVLEKMNQSVAATVILGVMAIYIIMGICWVSRKI